MESIKEMMIRIGLDPEHIKHIEYRKCQYYLTKIIERTEASLIKLQEQDGMNVVSARQKDVENTLNQLIFCHNKMYEMEGIIHALRGENELLNNRINAKT